MTPINNAQMAQAIQASLDSMGATATKKSDFIKYNLIGKKSNKFVASISVLPTTEKAVLKLLEAISDIVDIVVPGSTEITEMDVNDI